MSGKVSYNVCFHDLEMGLQTHCYAPMGLNIRGKWTLGGSLPGEPVAPVELGVGAPLQGLWLREDVDMRCNIMMTGFVKKTLKKAHASLVDRLVIKAKIVEASMNNQRLNDKTLISQGQFLGSQSSMQYSPTSEYDSQSLIDEAASGAFNPYAPQSPPVVPNPSFRGPEIPEFRDKASYDSSLYPKALSVRSSSASWNSSMTGSQNPRDSGAGSQNARVSWLNLNPMRSPSMQQSDPAYQRSIPYRSSSQSYHAAELSSDERQSMGRQDPKDRPNESAYPDHAPPHYGPAELEG